METTHQPRRNRRPGRRKLFCPAHPEQRIEGNGKKYFLHLMSPEQLKARGMPHKTAQFVIQAYPVLVLSNELAGGAVLPAVRVEPLVPHRQDRPGGASSEMGTARALATGRACRPKPPKPQRQRIQPPQRATDVEQKSLLGSRLITSPSKRLLKVSLD